MIEFKITKKGKSFEQIIKAVEIAKEIQLQEFHQLGEKAHKAMISYIAKNKKRRGSKGKFEKAITLERTLTTWGIGNISELDAKIGKGAWAAINWGTGSKHPAAGKRVPVGSFRPGKKQPDQASFRAGTWIKGNGNYSFVPVRPIPPMNYIEKTELYLNGLIKLYNKKMSDVFKRI